MPQHISNDTILDALQTMNRAIEENKDAIFFQALLQACKSFYEDKPLGVAIYRTDPEVPHEFYTVRMRDGEFHLVGRCQELTQVDWRVSEDYLRDLANNRNKYIDHPEKLSLNWLAERVVAMKA